MATMRTKKRSRSVQSVTQVDETASIPEA